MRAQRTAMGRPLVIVEDYGSLPELYVAIRSVSEGAAKYITFEFSVPFESSNGFVISDLPYFTYGLDFLPPNGESPATGTSSIPAAVPGVEGP